MRALVVGRNPRRRAALGDLLAAQGCSVERLDLAQVGQAGASVDARVAGCTLVLFDLVGPHHPGLDALRCLREQHPQVPVLALAAGGSAEARILALDAGADDCVPGDVADAELAARVRVRLRRRCDGRARRQQVGPLAYDRCDRTAFLDEQPLRLSHRELSLFEALIGRPGILVSVQSLLVRVFDRHEGLTPNAVQVQVCRLRRKIRHEAVRITTVRGLGYCLEVDRGEAAR